MLIEGSKARQLPQEMTYASAPQKQVNSLHQFCPSVIRPELIYSSLQGSSLAGIHDWLNARRGWRAEHGRPTGPTTRLTLSRFLERRGESNQPSFLRGIVISSLKVYSGNGAGVRPRGLPRRVSIWWSGNNSYPVALSELWFSPDWCGRV